ncbi:MAG: glycine betaine ABC transporter substrate-binding protein [Fimbriimonas sp.]
MKSLVLVFLTLLGAMASAQNIAVGSKKFTESYVLGEIAKRALTEAGLEVEHKQGMGATAIVWNALTGGSIAAYPEYTGTVSEELLKRPGMTTEAMREELKRRGLGMSKELGFNNTYGLVMRRADAEKLGISKISDLVRHPTLRCGITHELLGRADGWKGLTAKYALKFDEVKGVDHALGYAALFAGQTDVKDCYTTDAEIKKYDLRVLQDDREYFPKYRAVFLYRLDAPPKLAATLDGLGGTLDETKMIALNEEANRTKDYAAAAARYFDPTGPAAATADPNAVLPKLLGQHLILVGVSLLLAVLVGIPLGIAASRGGALGGGILGVTGVIQTIPSLALLALMVAIPAFGISLQTAIVALFLYSLLPIVRNTAAGIAGISGPLRESAAALGLEPMARLRKVYLPMALPTILAGIKTSAVINVGTATLAALIGQGGLGEPIVSGLALNDTPTILRGAIPAAILAVVVQGAFDLIERAVVPRGLKIRAR